MKPDDRSTGPGCHGLWLMYLPQHLDVNGDIKADPGIDRARVEFATAVTAMATRAAAGKRPGRVACRAYGQPTTCGGQIETAIAQRPRRIEWWCPVCWDSGSIFGWEWTRWNRMVLSGGEQNVAKTKKKRKTAQGIRPGLE